MSFKFIANLIPEFFIWISSKIMKMLKKTQTLIKQKNINMISLIMTKYLSCINR